MPSADSNNFVTHKDEIIPVQGMLESSASNMCDAHAIATTSCGNEYNNQRSTSQPTSINIREASNSQNHNNNENRTNTSKSSSRDLPDGNNEILAVTKVDAMNTDENDVHISMVEEDDYNVKVSDHHATSDPEASQMSNQSSDQARLSPMLSGDNEDDETGGEEPPEVRYTPAGNKFQCNFCPKILAASSRARHTLTHTGETPYKCDICANLFADRSALKRHRRTHTEEKPYKCNVCGECFTQSSALKCHNRTHTGEKPYECNVCGDYFTQSSHLLCHNRTHTGEKPYECEVCGECFTHSSTLKSHNRIHTGEKPYKCEVCGKCFTQSCTLKSHNRIHTGETPFECKLCGEAFTRSEDKKRHINKIHRIRKKHFGCKRCLNEFTRDDSCVVHIRKYHRDIPRKDARNYVAKLR